MLALPVPVGAVAVKTVRLVLVAFAKLATPPVLPAMPRVKPAAPCTAKVPLAVTGPFNPTAPVPVLKVPGPVIVKLPPLWV